MAHQKDTLQAVMEEAGITTSHQTQRQQQRSSYATREGRSQTNSLLPTANPYLSTAGVKPQGEVARQIADHYEKARTLDSAARNLRLMVNAAKNELAVLQAQSQPLRYIE